MADIKYLSNIIVDGLVTAKTLTLSTLSTQASEATALMINGSGVVGTRELGSNAFNSTTIPSINYGSNEEIPFMNGTTAFEYSSVFYYDPVVFGLYLTSSSSQVQVGSSQGLTVINANTITFNEALGTDSQIISTRGGFEQTLNFITPIADHTIQVPNATGTITLNGRTDAGYLLDTTDTLTGDLTVTGKVIAGTDPKTTYDVNVGTLGIGVDRTNGITFTGASVLGSKIFADTFSNLIFSTRLTSTPYTLNQRMIIENSTGNVGIGVADPLATLDILSNITSDSQNTVLKLKTDTTSDNGGAVTCDIDFFIDDNNTTTGTVPQARIGIIGTSTATQNAEAGGRLCFYTNTYSNLSPVLTERMRIDGENGNVGIGVVDPDTKLDVNGTIQAFGVNLVSGGTLNTYNGDLYIYNTTTKNILLGGSIGNFQNDVIIGNGDLTLTGSGNKIGIGTSIPEALLHISSGSTGDAVIIIESDTDNAGSEDDNPRVDFYQDNRVVHSKIGINGLVGSSFTNALDNASYFGTPTGHALQLFTNNTARLSIESGGDIGIGVTNPLTELHVEASNAGPVANEYRSVIYANNTSTSGTYPNSVGLYAKVVTTAGYAVYGQSPSTAWAGYFDGRGYFSQNVGIGNTNNTYKLDVTGTGRFTSTVTATNFILSSDERLKDNIKDFDYETHINMGVKSYELKSEKGVKRIGVIAQELEVNHPEFVRTDNEGMKSVAYIDLLIAKVAELEARLEKLEK